MKRILMGLLLIGASVAMIAGATLAYFSDAETSSGNTFTAGTLNLTLGGNSLPFAVGNMAPGDVVTVTQTISNTGSLELRYAMTTTVTLNEAGLADKLQLVISPAGYNGNLSKAAFGDPAQGPQTGDRVLAAKASEVLTFVATLPTDADNTYQSKNAKVNFNFAAEQTANNP